MQVIETEHEFNEFLSNIQDSNIIIIPVLSDNFKHYVNNRISFIFVHDLKSTHEYVISFHHSIGFEIWRYKWFQPDGGGGVIEYF